MFKVRPILKRASPKSLCLCSEMNKPLVDSLVESLDFVGLYTRNDIKECPASEANVAIVGDWQRVYKDWRRASIKLSVLEEDEDNEVTFLMPSSHIERYYAS